ncbi:hypothetical protein Droror1_Dr00011806 [Drosera rotundifolia]
MFLIFDCGHDVIVVLLMSFMKNSMMQLFGDESMQPRGFGFVQYVDPCDAAEAKYRMHGQQFQGFELTVVFAVENRKKPVDMRARDRGSRRDYDRRRSPARYYGSTRDSPTPPRGYDRSLSRSHDYHSPSPRKKHYSSILYFYVPI